MNRVETYLKVELSFASCGGSCMRTVWTALRDLINDETGI